MRRLAYFTFSLALHAALIGTLCLRLKPSENTESSHTIAIELTSPKTALALTKNAAPVSPDARIDLRPNHVRNFGAFAFGKTRDTAGTQFGIANPVARDLLFTPPKVFLAFDRLAEKVNASLDYPSLLIENSVEGTATLDLFFDHDGNVDEDHSKFFGANRFVRGVLVKASRTALIQWYRADAVRLNKDQFRDQHFRAELSISYVRPDESRMEKTSSGSYLMVRRHYMHECATPFGLDVACLALKAKGATERAFSDGYKNRFDDLKENLSHFDDIALGGINSAIKGS